MYGVTVQQVGFVERDENVGCSPDGFVGDDGMVEIKCPKTTTHLETIFKDKVQTCYTAQIQGNLWVCERKWCDYVSFDPRMKSNKGHCVRVERDDSYIDNLNREVIGFLLDLKELIGKIDNSPF